MFREVKGVVETAVGFMGGKTKNPSYKDVCRKNTGHVEVCSVDFDSKKISYEKLLEFFWKMHDPTQFNMQGPDVGEQYRGVIFWHDAKQKNAATKMKSELQKTERFKGRKMATAIEKAGKFYKAEEHHQRYLEKHGLANCHV